VIVDTSALVAIAKDEPGSEALRQIILEGAAVPAPALVEYRRVMTNRGSGDGARAEAVLQKIIGKLAIEPFTAEDAEIAGRANIEHGSGNGRGGTLNLLDLMVYAIAKRTRRPILCTAAISVPPTRTCIPPA
jgi:ribonuclease VapC